MPSPTVRASAAALPISSRRLFLAGGTAAAVFATVKRAAPAAALISDDAELFALAEGIAAADEALDRSFCTSEWQASDPEPSLGS
jgi:hypothetical protein